jgi:DNA-binding MarR family transcriptional regulator
MEKQRIRPDKDKLWEAGKTCACFNVRKAARSVTQIFEKSLKDSGLLATQFTLMAATSLLQPVPLTRLADAVGMDRTTLTRNLRPLVKKGYIRIESGDDERVRKVSVTDSGSEALANAIPSWEKAQAQVVANLGEDRFQRVLQDLSAMASAN